MRKRILGVALSAATLAALAIPLLGGSVSAAPKPKFPVCHYDEDGIAAPGKLLKVGSLNAQSKHVANHKTIYGHDGNDYIPATGVTVCETH